MTTKLWEEPAFKIKASTSDAEVPSMTSPPRRLRTSFERPKADGLSVAPPRLFFERMALAAGTTTAAAWQVWDAVFAANRARQRRPW